MGSSFGIGKCRLMPCKGFARTPPCRSRRSVVRSRTTPRRAAFRIRLELEKQTAPVDQGAVAVAKKITRAGSLPTSGVGAQAHRKIHQRRYPARLGPVAPVLELAQELLLGRMRALPKRGQLVAHGDHRGERPRILQRLG